MKKWLILVAALWITLGLWSLASANSSYTITFDEAANPSNKIDWGVLPDGYMGLDWQFLELEKYNDYKKSNSGAHFPSPPFAVFNGGPSKGYMTVSFSSDHPFVFEGAFFSTWANKNKFTIGSANGLIVTGYLDGKVVGSTRFPLTPEFIWQNINFGVVDLVELTNQEHDNKYWWLMDNMKVSATPLPNTMFLFGGGLIALGLFGKRRS
jgi:hypothetical protein